MLYSNKMPSCFHKIFKWANQTFKRTEGTRNEYHGFTWSPTHPHMHVKTQQQDKKKCPTYTARAYANLHSSSTSQRHRSTVELRSLTSQNTRMHGIACHICRPYIRSPRRRRAALPCSCPLEEYILHHLPIRDEIDATGKKEIGWRRRAVPRAALTSTVDHVKARRSKRAASDSAATAGQSHAPALARRAGHRRCPLTSASCAVPPCQPRPRLARPHHVALRRAFGISPPMPLPVAWRPPPCAGCRHLCGSGPGHATGRVRSAPCWCWWETGSERLRSGGGAGAEQKESDGCTLGRGRFRCAVRRP